MAVTNCWKVSAGSIAVIRSVMDPFSRSQSLDVEVTPPCRSAALLAPPPPQSSLLHNLTPVPAGDKCRILHKDIEMADEQKPGGSGAAPLPGDEAAGQPAKPAAEAPTPAPQTPASPPPDPAPPPATPTRLYGRHTVGKRSRPRTQGDLRRRRQPNFHLPRSEFHCGQTGLGNSHSGIPEAGVGFRLPRGCHGGGLAQARRALRCGLHFV